MKYMYINLNEKEILISEYKCLSVSNNETVKTNSK